LLLKDNSESRILSQPGSDGKVHAAPLKPKTEQVTQLPNLLRM
jgi:hypothetical protein